MCRRGARQLIENLCQLLDLPPVDSTFDRLLCKVQLVSTITYQMCWKKCWGARQIGVCSKLDIYYGIWVNCSMAVQSCAFSQIVVLLIQRDVPWYVSVLSVQWTIPSTRCKQARSQGGSRATISRRWVGQKPLFVSFFLSFVAFLAFQIKFFLGGPRCSIGSCLRGSRPDLEPP